MSYIQYRNVKRFKIANGYVNMISNPMCLAGKDDEYRLKNGVLTPLDAAESANLEKDLKRETNKELDKISPLTKYSDSNFSYCISVHYDYCLNKKIRDEPLKKVYSLVEIFYRGISVDYLFCNAKAFEYIRQVKEEFKSSYASFTNSSDYKGNIPLKFTGHAAVVFAHELLGHMFEIDNYYFYNYKQSITDIESLNLTVWDNPLIMDSSAYYKYDDAGIEAKITKIFDKGAFTGQLIGGNIDELVVKSSLRRDMYSSKLQPRMSNFIVESSQSKIVPSAFFIEVLKLSKCFVDHTKKVLKLSVELANYNDNSGIICRVNPFTLELRIPDLLKKIYPLKNHGSLRPLQCYKKRQVIECGGSSCDWLLTNELEA